MSRAIDHTPLPPPPAAATAVLNADPRQRIDEEHFEHGEQHLSVVAQHAHALLRALAERALHTGH